MHLETAINKIIHKSKHSLHTNLTDREKMRLASHAVEMQKEIRRRKDARQQGGERTEGHKGAQRKESHRVRRWMDEK